MSGAEGGTGICWPLLIVLSGPSGVGKDAILTRMKELGKPYHFTVTATTRAQRPAEQDGVDYIFLSCDEFRAMIRRNEFLEWAEVYGNLYGVPRDQVTGAFSNGHDVLIKADVQGAATIRSLSPEALSIFLAPSSMKELEQRLRARLTESPQALETRLRTAKAEMEEGARFDYTVVNRQDHLDEAVEAIDRIVAKERTRVPPRCARL